MKPEPYYCPTCADEIIETDEGNVLGYYGVLVRDGVPMTGAGDAATALTCPNCGSALAPVASRFTDIGQDAAA